MMKHILVLLMMLLNFCVAAEEPIVEEEESESDFSWQLMVSFALRNNTSIIVGSDANPRLDIPILFDMYYKGFFIQSNARKFSNVDQGVAIGYEIITREDWQLDVISKSYISGFSEEGVNYFDQDNPAELKGIRPRDDDDSEGLRFTYFMDDAVLWVDAAANLISNVHNGWLIDTYYSLRLPYWNWDFYLGTGLSIYSAKFTDYYYGVSQQEATPFRPEYEAGISYRTQFELVGQYPLSENWLLGAGIHASHYSSEISHSPLVKKNNNLQFILDFRYVF